MTTNDPIEQPDTTARLAPFLFEEDGVAQIVCAHCGNTRSLTHLANQGMMMAQWVYEDRIMATLVCGECKGKSVFHMRGNNITFLPGKVIDRPETDIGADALAAFDEAVAAYEGQSYRACVAFCRSAVEDSLDHKNVPGQELFGKAQNAHGKGLPLDDEAFALATGARLIGRNTLHRKMEVSASQALAMLSGTLDVLNHIGAQPAMQSGTDSNEP